jgi:oligopeptide/dipeptide ABC transporter ATP-binding protein
MTDDTSARAGTPAAEPGLVPHDAPNPAADDDPEALLRVDQVRKHFPIRRGIFFKRQVGSVKAVDGVSFTLRRGDTLGLVGESGCGKSTIGRVITKLHEPTSGSIRFDGRELANLTVSQMRPVRRDIQMIFQDPFSSLNPRHTIGTIVGAPFKIQGTKTEHGIKAEVQALLERVGLNPEHYNRYPHEFSGGQRQRIGVARAIALRPKLIVCDEPVSALDVSIQAQVVNLLEDLQSEYDLAYIFVAHDLSVVRHISDRVAVMYLGKLMELAERDVLYTAPIHPYTHALMSAVPTPDPAKEARRQRILLKGDLPSPINPPPGCVFHTRCPKYRDKLGESDRERCRTEVPPFEVKAVGHFAACHFPEVRADIVAPDATNVAVSAATAAPPPAAD